MAFGLCEDDFWRRTPRQIERTFKAHGIRLTREHNAGAWVVWHIANLERWPRKKKLPSLKSLQIRERAKAPQSLQQQLAIVKQITLMMGGTIKKAGG